MAYVPSVSSMFSASSRSVTTMAERELPPRLSCSSRVSFESRQGTCAPLPAWIGRRGRVRARAGPRALSLPEGDCPYLERWLYLLWLYLLWLYLLWLYLLLP